LLYCQVIGDFFIFLFLGLAALVVDTTIEAVAFNMGKWETANSNDPLQYALDCHGHAHFLLTSSAFSALQDYAQYRPLIGRFRDPDGHLEDDCRELETARLLGIEGDLLRIDMAEVKNNIALILQLLQAKKE